MRRFVTLILPLVIAGCAAHTTAAVASRGPVVAPAPAPTDAEPRIAVITATPPAPGDARPWGEPVPSPQTERQVQTVLAALADSRARPHFSDIVMIGPGLWRGVGSGSLSDAGTPAENRVPNRNGVQVFPMRMFALNARGDAVTTLLAAREMRALGGFFATAVVRPATEPERRLFYALIPFEIAGQPVTVAERGDDRLVVSLDRRNQVHWIERLSAFESAVATP